MPNQLHHTLSWVRPLSRIPPSSYLRTVFCSLTSRNSQRFNYYKGIRHNNKGWGLWVQPLISVGCKCWDGWVVFKTSEEIASSEETGSGIQLNVFQKRQCTVALGYHLSPLLHFPTSHSRGIGYAIPSRPQHIVSPVISSSSATLLAHLYT